MTDLTTPAHEAQEAEDRDLEEEEEIAEEAESRRRHKFERLRWEGMSDRQRVAEIRWATNHGG